MRHKTPVFWQTQNWISRLLQPIAYLIYGLRVWRQMGSRPYRAKVPVICVGNVTMGGAGKTPICMKLALLAQASGLKPFFVSRGYGGSYEGIIQVDKQKHAAALVGDEPLLLSEYAEVIIGKNKKQAIRKAVSLGAELIILDDGLQNTTIHKDISLLVIDGMQGIGNGWLFPAGPLREPLKIAEKKCDLVVIMGSDIHNVRYELHQKFIQTSIQNKLPHGLKNKSVIAFAGLGFPEKFFISLRALPLEIIETISYPDHYPYTVKDIEQMQKQAIKHQATLVTTAKDWVRIPEELRSDIRVIEHMVTLTAEGEQILKRLLLKKDL